MFGKKEDAGKKAKKPKKEKKKPLTRTQKKDLRDNTSLLISAAGLGISAASLLLVLNKKPNGQCDGNRTCRNCDRCTSSMIDDETGEEIFFCNLDEDEVLSCLDNGFSLWIPAPGFLEDGTPKQAHRRSDRKTILIDEFPIGTMLVYNECDRKAPRFFEITEIIPGDVPRILCTEYETKYVYNPDSTHSLMYGVGEPFRYNVEGTYRPYTRHPSNPQTYRCEVDGVPVFPYNGKPFYKSTGPHSYDYYRKANYVLKTIN